MKAHLLILSCLLVACTVQPTQKTADSWAERPIASKKIFDVAWFDGDWRLCEVGIDCRNATRKTAIRSIPKTAAIPAAEKIRSDQIQVHFALNSADPQDLSALKQFLEVEPDHKKLLVTGYTDSLGDETYNQLLARKRANKISAWIRKRGIRNPIEVASRGACCYLAANDTEKGRALNRRVVVEIIHEEK